MTIGTKPITSSEVKTGMKLVRLFKGEWIPFTWSRFTPSYIADYYVLREIVNN
jgi:hypothetical protein